MNSEFSIQIFKNGKINPMFVKAHLAILKKHEKNLLIGSDIQENNDLLSQLWHKEYSVNIVDNCMCFNSLEEMTMFLLKWGR
jgi:hypothetical protein